MAEKIEKVDVIDIAKSNMREYAREVITSRAIPSALDGLKPVQRAIIYQMHDMGLTPNSRHVKVAKVVGSTMGNFHPHGDGSIEGALTAMSRAWERRLPLVDIHGNNGNVDGLGAAAGRYIECRESFAAQMMTEGLSDDAVEMVPNYDGTLEMPSVLPARLPMGYVNGTEGIAYGMATTILPHNPIELVELMRLSIEGNLTVETAKEVFNGPDFPTGNQIIEGDPYAELSHHKSSFTIRAKSRIVKNQIIIDEVPFGKSTEQMIVSLASVAASIPEIRSIDNETETFPKVRIVISCSKTTSRERMEQILTILENKTFLTLKVNCNNLMIVDGHPRYLTTLEMIEEFVKFRTETLKRIWASKLGVVCRKLSLATAERDVLNDLDALREILDTADSKQSMIDMFIEKFDFDQIQAKHVSEMQTYRWLKTDGARVSELDKSIKKLNLEIKKFENNLGKGLKSALLADCDETLNLLQDMGNVSRRLTSFGEAREMSKSDIVKSKIKAVSRTPVNLRASTVSAIISTGALDNDEKPVSLTVPGDHLVAVVSRSGKAVIRLAAEFSVNERVNRTVEGISSDDAFVGIVDLTEKGCVVTLSKRGYMKKIDVQTLQPNLSTRRYLKKAHLISGLKGGDDLLVFVGKYPTDLTGEALKLSLDRTRKPHVVIDLSVINERNDSGSSSGAVMLNTHKGADRIKSIEPFSIEN